MTFDVVFFLVYVAMISLLIGFIVGMKVHSRISRRRDLQEMIAILEAVMVENDDQRAVRDRLTRAFRWLLDGKRVAEREGDIRA
jgi:hypothetical protein